MRTPESSGTPGCSVCVTLDRGRAAHHQSLKQKGILGCLLKLSLVRHPNIRGTELLRSSVRLPQKGKQVERLVLHRPRNMLAVIAARARTRRAVYHVSFRLQQVGQHESRRDRRPRVKILLSLSHHRVHHLVPGT